MKKKAASPKPADVPKPSRKPPLILQVPWQQEAQDYIRKVLLKEAQLRTTLKGIGWLAPDDAEALKEQFDKGKQHVRDLLAIIARQQTQLEQLQPKPARARPTTKRASKAPAKKAAAKTPTRHRRTA